MVGPAGGSPQLDLAILTLADHAILHCPSSFSNVAKRLRGYPSEYDGQVYRSTSFWGVEASVPAAGGAKAEL